VHRPRYDDWSMPKGKADRDEHLTLTAVREVHEETGVRVALRRPLPVRRYQVDGVPKVVHYWRAVAVAEDTFVATDEVDETRWLPIDEAQALVSHPDDASIVKLAAEPCGTPFIVMRHGAAVKRVDWAGDDVDRPLDAHGIQQSATLIERLVAFGVLRVHSSAARRCADTVRPYALAQALPLIAEPALTEESFHASPDAVFERAGQIITDSWRGQVATVLCGHRPYLPDLVERLVALCPPGSAADPWSLPLPDTMPTASMTVLHVHQDEHDGHPLSLALEYFPH
jgi:8-oxo-dGTP diphosphatase